MTRDALSLRSRSSAPESLPFEDLFRRVPTDQAVELLPRFLAGGGDVNARDPDLGWTLLHAACEHGNHALIEALAQAGADLNAPSLSDGWTPLHHAVDIDIDAAWQATQEEEAFLRELTLPTVGLLLSLGADPAIPDASGKLPRELAAGYGPDVLTRYNSLASRAVQQ